MSSPPNDIIILLDESGSMRLMGDEPIHAINSFIQDQKRAGSEHSRLTIWKFNNKPMIAIDNILLSSVSEFTDFNPQGMTSLYDAIGSAITEKKGIRNVTCVILTDGYNNSSVNFSSSMINTLVKECETVYDWIFHFLGANQDSFTSGKKIGISRCSTFTTDNNTIKDVLRNTSIEIGKQRCGNISEEPPPPPSSSPSCEIPLLTRQSSTFYR
jgi:hypothetical protein